MKKNWMSRILSFILAGVLVLGAVDLPVLAATDEQGEEIEAEELQTEEMTEEESQEKQSEEIPEVTEQEREDETEELAETTDIIDETSSEAVKAAVEVNMENTEAGETISSIFADPVVARSVAAELGKSVADTVTQEELDTIEVIDFGAWEDTASSLDGINRLRNLELLWAGYNDITTIAPGTFDGMDNLEAISLTGNGINEISADMFQGLAGLERLYLDYNNLTNIPADLFDILNNLEQLDINGNQLKDISNVPDTVAVFAFNQNITIYAYQNQRNYYEFPLDKLVIRGQASGKNEVTLESEGVYRYSPEEYNHLLLLEPLEYTENGFVVEIESKDETISIIYTIWVEDVLDMWIEPIPLLAVGESHQLDVYYYMYDLAGYEVEIQYESTNPKVVTVDENGLMRVIGKGTAEVVIKGIVLGSDLVTELRIEIQDAVHQTKVDKSTGVKLEGLFNDKTFFVTDLDDNTEYIEFLLNYLGLKPEEAFDAYIDIYQDSYYVYTYDNEYTYSIPVSSKYTQENTTVYYYDFHTDEYKVKKDIKVSDGYITLKDQGWDNYYLIVRGSSTSVNPNPKPGTDNGQNIKEVQRPADAVESPKNGVLVSGLKNKKITVRAEKVDKADKAYIKVFEAMDAKVKADQISDYVVLDISLLEAGSAVQLEDGKVQVYVPLPDGYDPARVKVYHYVNDKLVEISGVQVVRMDGVLYVLFETDSFSPFVIAQVEADAKPNKSTPNKTGVPATGDTANRSIYFMIMAACILCAGYYAVRKKKYVR